MGGVRRGLVGCEVKSLEMKKEGAKDKKTITDISVYLKRKPSPLHKPDRKCLARRLPVLRPQRLWPAAGQQEEKRL